MMNAATAKPHLRYNKPSAFFAQQVIGGHATVFKPQISMSVGVIAVADIANDV
jgi:hypothetical protein